MSQLRNVFSGLAQSWTKPTTVPNPPLISSTCLIRATRSSGVPIVAADSGENAVFSIASSGSLNGFAGALQGADDVLVVMAQQSLARFGNRLLAGLGDVPGKQHAPVFAADGGAVFCRRQLGKAPLRA